LRWRDVDLSAGLMTVEVQLARGGRGLAPLKGDKSHRTIRLPQTMHLALVSHRESQAHEAEHVGSQWKDSGMVFTTLKGAALPQTAMHRRFKELLIAAQLPDVRIHDMRHGAASVLYDMGLDIKQIQELLGHGSASFTSDTYAHSGTPSRDATANAIESWLSGVATSTDTAKRAKRSK
jgi:integrase